MTMMMTGRVLLVCALCVLWCGVCGLPGIAADGVGGGDGSAGEDLLLQWRAWLRRECAEQVSRRTGGGANVSAVEECVRQGMESLHAVTDGRSRWRRQRIAAAAAADGAGNEKFIAGAISQEGRSGKDNVLSSVKQLESPANSGKETAGRSETGATLQNIAETRARGETEKEDLISDKTNSEKEENEENEKKKNAKQSEREDDEENDEEEDGSEEAEVKDEKETKEEGGKGDEANEGKKRKKKENDTGTTKEISAGSEEQPILSSGVEELANQTNPKSTQTTGDDDPAADGAGTAEGKQNENKEANPKETPLEATATKNTTATTGDSDGSTAVSHTTSPLLLLLVVVACAAAAAVVAA
ncbi:Mucin-associated surface protein (MASP) [Trypanosoma cruzi]|uniref:Mucin-associated surface protein (MASP), putative n=2 Tax=Trypanosoma cruzi TaxID=5693 RepID=Q4E3E7_TRYCC|nr:mucin-associated surface protein (MASP), putative [Trypanosoma cruzi]EAN99287.1 mucin-associated surface protein (MASP), putative [Trypanosoma cruzi]PWV20781.1 Mucin-associated surface protein (MASP) [Trypanosoma cruzi]|eukprot:XP_821138.1 mucin-associated surface protein (MASP) [Trypanosoma cruzi strain CL Brener]